MRSRISCRRVLEVRDDDNRHACCLCGARSVLAVFKRQALGWLYLQPCSGQPVQRRVGLAPLHLVAARQGLEVVQHLHAAQAVLDLVAP